MEMPAESSSLVRTRIQSRSSAGLCERNRWVAIWPLLGECFVARAELTIPTMI
jgi:hypothetical protein